jgi:hypothetical protein
MIIFVLLLFCSPPHKTPANITTPNKSLFDTSLTALYIPLDKISLSMVQDKDLAALKKSNPIYLFAKKPKVSQPSINYDSFYIEMANALALYEVSKHFKLFQHKADTGDSRQQDSIAFQLPAYWSRLSQDTGSFEKISFFVKKTTEKYGVDLIIVPCECLLKETETETPAWRDNKYGKYYEKPSTIDAKAVFHVQIWDKNGCLLYERKGTGLSKRPVLYDALKQKKPSNQSLNEYSKNIFAPTLVRALGEACRNAFPGQ